MDDVDHEEHDCLGQLNLVTIETVWEDHQVEQDEDRLTSDDPPVNQSSSGNNQVEYAYTKNPIRTHRSTYIIVTYLGWSASRKLPARPQSKYQYQKPQRKSSSW